MIKNFRRHFFLQYFFLLIQSFHLTCDAHLIVFALLNLETAFNIFALVLVGGVDDTIFVHAKRANVNAGALRFCLL